MRCFGRFCHDEKGSVTVEFVLWIPVLMALLVIVVDAATLYVTHKEMWNVARDTARRMVKDPIKYTSNDCQAAEDHIANSMSLRDLPYVPQMSYDSSTGAEVSIILRTNDMAIFGYYSALVIHGRDMMARVAMRAAPNAPGPLSVDC